MEALLLWVDIVAFRGHHFSDIKFMALTKIIHLQNMAEGVETQDVICNLGTRDDAFYKRKTLAFQSS